MIYRQEVRPFTDKQIALLQNFVAQAAIAMENARLLGELRGRTRDLQESLEYQTTTSEVLKIISRSTFDLQRVLEILAESATTLAQADYGLIFRGQRDACRLDASFGQTREFNEAYIENLVLGPGRGTSVGRALSTGQVVQIADVVTDPEYALRDFTDRAALRTALSVPMLRQNEPVGVISLGRRRVQPFTDKQIELVSTFADQAVIAIENARLITETREALERQTATAELLQVINASPGNLAPVFDAMLDRALRLCEAAFGSLWTCEAGLFDTAATRNRPAVLGELVRHAYKPGPDSALGRLVGSEPFVHGNAAEDESYRSGNPARRALVDLAGARTYLAVPLRKGDALLGAFTIYRQEIRAFTEEQIALLESFAAQAVIAMDNARLLDEIRAGKEVAEEASRTIESAYQELKAAQAKLVQAEKMASLGQLTAGIAHEIKNPLNFVNNFAGLSGELLEELREAAAPAIAALGEDKRAELDEVIETLSINLEKIAEHGKRADGIVKGMLEHSRGGTGESRSVDLNLVVEESLNLAYHGARAQDQNFNITLERDLDPTLAPIEVVPQDITRVFLNLFGNGFYAAKNRRRSDAAPDLQPILKVATRDLGSVVEIKIRDNGIGIPPEIKDKLFQFTTKPTGEGTGLGLSISYDIVVQQHGGTIEVDSRVGEFTEFTVRLPRRGHTTAEIRV